MTCKQRGVFNVGLFAQEHLDRLSLTQTKLKFKCSLSQQQHFHLREKKKSVFLLTWHEWNAAFGRTFASWGHSLGE